MIFYQYFSKGQIATCASENPLLALKNYCRDLLKSRSVKLALKRRRLSCFCGWPYWICICWSFPFRREIYGRRVFKWITQRDLLMFALVNLPVFAPLFNAQKKHVLTHFTTWLQLLLLGGDTAENRGRVVEGRKYFPLVLIYFECTIALTNCIKYPIFM